jgi:outer membrane protein assembly factor BamB
VLPTNPIAYETKNVAWMTYLPGTTVSQPIVVRDRIFASFGNSDLICLNKADGKILWMRPNYQYDAMTEAERAAEPGLKDRVEPLLAKMRRMNDEVIKEINAAISPNGVAPDRLSALKRLLAERDLLDKSIHNEASAVDRKKYPRLYESEVSSCDATPCSNGKLVYAVYGGGRDKAGCLIVCYDLEGNRQWNFHEALGAGEHSNHASPVLIGDRLIHTVNKTILGFDAQTGQVQWRHSNPNWYLVESSGWPVRVGATEAVAVDLAIVRAGDGHFLWNGPDKFWHIMWHVPVVENGIVYSLGCQTGYSLRECITAVELAEKAAGQWEPRVQWKIKNADIAPSFTAPAYDADHIASPLYCDGLLYTVDMMGLLMVLDARTGKRVYQRTLDMNQQCTRMDFGVAASPTLGGKRLYLLDNLGTSLVLEPGAMYKEAGRNILEDSDGPQWGGQERFFTSPVFDGNSILIRGRGYLYCIRAAKQKD